MARSTDRAKRAAMYREAANIVECGIDAHSCHAIYRATGLGVPDEWEKRLPCSDADEYDELFRPDDPGAWGESWGICWGDERHDCRVVALCFMAAMVEAGDA